MASGGGDIKAVYDEWCARGKTKLQSREFAAWCVKAGIIPQGKTPPIDIVFSKCTKGRPNKKDLELSDIDAACECLAGDKSVALNDKQAIKSKLAQAKKGPATGVTKPSETGGVDRLTDTSKYTGAHKERFDKSGKGKGAEGRVDRDRNTGYVGAYKGEGSYGKK